MKKECIIKIKESKKARMNREELIDINREAMFNLIRNYEEDALIRIEGPSELIELLLFDINKYTGIKEINIPDDIIYRLDYTDVSFDNACVKDFDFTGMYGVSINPQTVFNKNLRNTILNGVSITGSLDDVYIPGTNFVGSVGALINPQEVYDKDLSRAVIADCIVVNDFDGVKLRDTIIYDTTMIMEKCDYEKVKEMKKVLIKAM